MLGKTFQISFVKNPWQQLTASFVLLITSGAILLKLPFVRHADGLSWTDAFFTSTSAVCVTGLTTVSTSGFNLWGKIIILLLIQIGAIGIMTLTSSFFLSLKGKIDLKTNLLYAQNTDSLNLQAIQSVLKNIIKITFWVELTGAILLTWGFYLEGHNPEQAAYLGIFHSVSAFANAGFSTFDSGLIDTNNWIKITTALLIIIGGLGYFVIIDLIYRFPKKRKLNLHSQIVIKTSAALVLAGWLLLLWKENMSWTDAFFQSVTTRTAGFNTVEIGRLSDFSIFLFAILMFIGASPGSTGGGIKTTNFFIMIVSVFSVLKGKKSVIYRNRTIGNNLILKAFGTSIIYFIILSFGILLLLFITDFGFKSVLFEAVSAIGTVGLSLGITPQLNTAGKWIIVALMFIGRLGPASFAMATLKTKKELHIKYPDAEIY